MSRLVAFMSHYSFHRADLVHLLVPASFSIQPHVGFRLGTWSSGAPAGISGSRATLCAKSFMILPKCAAVHEWMYGRSIALRSLGSTVRLITWGVASFSAGSVSVFWR